MNQSMLLLHEIMRAKWAIEPLHGLALVPIVDSFLSGEIPAQQLYQDLRPKKDTYADVM